MRKLLLFILIPFACKAQTKYDLSQDVKVTATNTNLASTNTKLATTNTNLASTNTKLATATTKLNTTASQLSTTAAQLSTVSTKVSTINISVATLDTRLTTLNSVFFGRTDSLFAQLATADTRIRTLEAQNATLAAQVNSLLPRYAAQDSMLNAVAFMAMEAGKKVSLSGMSGQIVLTKTSDSTYVIGLDAPAFSLMKNANPSVKKSKKKRK